MIRKAALALSSLAIAGLLALSPSRAEAQQTFTCESRGFDATRCNVDIRGGVRLVRQLSSAPCERGRSWNADSRGIWVSRGCRAQFQVGGRGNGRYDDRRDDRRDRDRDRWDDRSSRGDVNRSERVCRSVVRDRYRVGGVDVRYRADDRAGNHVIRWTSDRAAGSCLVSRNGRVLDIRANRR
ncbi:MAG TPA: DUF3011 domain-containing protein [Longimicrobium sp.]|jgi:hypothetical protein